jgi:hypothetical protein
MFTQAINGVVVASCKDLNIGRLIVIAMVIASLHINLGQVL